MDQSAPARIQSKEYISLGLHGSRFPVPLKETREDFQRQRAISITNLLEPALLQVLTRLSGPPWNKRLNAGGQVQFQDPPKGAKMMDLVLSRPEVLRWMEEVSGCSGLRFFGGEVFQIAANNEDHLTWHDDLMDPTRRLVLVVRVGATDYEGGELEMRERGGDTFLRHGYDGPGSAMMMALSAGLQHRVLPVTAGGPRLMYGGWAHV